MNEEQKQVLEVHLQEYDKLKGEQAQRIGFRDNLIYVILAVFGTILAFAVGDREKSNPYALLVLPWASLVLGWTYLINDEKITAIGRYIRYELAAKVSELTGNLDKDSLFGWETAHRSDRRRRRRKLEQLIIDEIAFVFSGIAALIAFGLNPPSPSVPFLYLVIGLCLFEFILLVILGVEIFIYADLGKGR